MVTNECSRDGFFKPSGLTFKLTRRDSEQTQFFSAAQAPDYDEVRAGLCGGRRVQCWQVLHRLYPDSKQIETLFNILRMEHRDL